MCARACVGTCMLVHMCVHTSAYVSVRGLDGALQCVFVCARIALHTQHAKRMRRSILSCDFSAYTIFFHIISQTARFSTKVTEYKMCVLNVFTTFILNISSSKKN